MTRTSRFVVVPSGLRLPPVRRHAKLEEPPRDDTMQISIKFLVEERSDAVELCEESRVLSGFHMYMRYRIAELKAQIKDELTQQERFAMASSEWKFMDADEKASFQR